MKQQSWTALAVVCVLCTMAFADIVREYDANPNPVTEEGGTWKLTYAGTASIDIGTETDGTKYWGIIDPGASRCYYGDETTSPDRNPSGIYADGWTYSVKLKVISSEPDPDYPTVVYSSAGFQVFDTARNWQISLTTSGVYYNQTSLIVAMDTTDAYHTYQMSWDPVADAVSVYIDGEKQVTIYSSDVPTTAWRGANWGSLSTGAKSTVRWNEVTLETGQIVPEPATCAILCSSIAVFFHVKKRKRMR